MAAVSDSASPSNEVYRPRDAESNPSFTVQLMPQR